MDWSLKQPFRIAAELQRTRTSPLPFADFDRVEREDLALYQHADLLQAIIRQGFALRQSMLTQLSRPL